MSVEEKDKKIESEFEWPLESKGYMLLVEIGRGAFAAVYRATCVKDRKKEVAIKILNLEKHDHIFQFIRNEIAIMSKLKHPNLVEMYCSFVEGTSLWVVMPLHRGGSCCHVMKTVEPTGFKDEVVVATIIREALKGLRYLHGGGHIHRDIKADNILISESGEIQLCDFGVAGAFIQNGARGRAINIVGTPCWMAPEVVNHSDGYDDRADIWSLGITTLELAFGMAPYEHETRDAVMRKIVDDDPPTPKVAYGKIPGRYRPLSKDLLEFVASCLQKDPNKRPTAAGLLSSRFLSKGRSPDYLADAVLSKLPKEYMGASLSQINTMALQLQQMHINDKGRPSASVARPDEITFVFPTYLEPTKKEEKSMSLQAFLEKTVEAGVTSSSSTSDSTSDSTDSSKPKKSDDKSAESEKSPTESEILAKKSIFDDDEESTSGGSTKEDKSILLAGWLHKKSPKNLVFSRHVWQKRYFVVRIDRKKKLITFLYYKQEPKPGIPFSEDTSLLGHIPMEEVRQLSLVEGKTGRFNLAVRSRTHGAVRVLELRAENLAEAQHWISNLLRFAKEIWLERRRRRQNYPSNRKVLLHAEIEEVLQMLQRGFMFEKYSEQSTGKSTLTIEKLIVELYWRDDGSQKGGKLYASEPRDRERQSLVRQGVSPAPLPTASVILPSMSSTGTAPLPIASDVLAIDSITEILIGKHTAPLLSPMASSAPDACCVSLAGDASWHLQADSQEQLHTLLLGIETLLKRCGKKIIRGEKDNSVLRVIERRHQSQPVNVLGLNLEAAVSPLRDARMGEHALVALEQRFTSKVKLVHPGRVLVRQGPLVSKKTYADQKYMFFLFNDLLVYAKQVGTKFKLKRTMPVGKDFQVIDLMDDPKRKNQFWIVSSEKTLLVQAADGGDKIAWMDDFSRVMHQDKEKEKDAPETPGTPGHEELLRRLQEEDYKSLKEKQQRKKAEPSLYSATEIGPVETTSPGGHQRHKSHAPTTKPVTVHAPPTTLDVSGSGEVSPPASPHSSPPATPQASRSTKELEDWLGGMSSAFLKYTKTFAENGMTLDYLVKGNVDDRDLELIGVHPVHRKRILFEIEQEKKRQKEDTKAAEDVFSSDEESDTPSTPQKPVPSTPPEKGGLPPPPPETGALPPPPPPETGALPPPPAEK